MLGGPNMLKLKYSAVTTRMSYASGTSGRSFLQRSATFESQRDHRRKAISSGTDERFLALVTDTSWGERKNIKKRPGARR